MTGPIVAVIVAALAAVILAAPTGLTATKFLEYFLFICMAACFFVVAATALLYVGGAVIDWADRR